MDDTQQLAKAAAQLHVAGGRNFRFIRQHKNDHWYGTAEIHLGRTTAEALDYLEAASKRLTIAEVERACIALCALAEGMTIESRGVVYFIQSDGLLSANGLAVIPDFHVLIVWLSGISDEDYRHLRMEQGYTGGLP